MKRNTRDWANEHDEFTTIDGNILISKSESIASRMIEERIAPDFKKRRVFLVSTPRRRDDFLIKQLEKIPK